jgi:hypothetical protein
MRQRRKRRHRIIACRRHPAASCSCSRRSPRRDRAQRPTVQTSARVVAFLSGHLGYPFPAPAVFNETGQRFRRAVADYARPMRASCFVLPTYRRRRLEETNRRIALRTLARCLDGAGQEQLEPAGRRDRRRSTMSEHREQAEPDTDEELAYLRHTRFGQLPARVRPEDLVEAEEAEPCMRNRDSPWCAGNGGRRYRGRHALLGHGRGTPAAGAQLRRMRVRDGGRRARCAADVRTRPPIAPLLEGVLRPLELRRAA